MVRSRTFIDKGTQRVPSASVDTLLDVQESVSAAQGYAAGSQDGAFGRLLSRYSSYRGPLHFRSDDRSSRCDLFGMTPGMLMLVVDVRPTQGFNARVLGQDIVEFHFRLSGSLAMAGSWGEVDIRDPSLLLWYQPSGCDDVQEQLGAASDTRESWVSLYCDRDWLLGVRDPRAMSALNEWLLSGDAQCGPRYKIISKLGVLDAILRDLVRNPYQNEMHDLYARAKGVELLCATLDSLAAQSTAPPPRLRLTSRDQRAIREAGEILSREFVDPPSLPALSRRIGVNTGKLCAGFRELYGETVSEFARRCRMERAHQLLSGSDLQVRQIARAVGYQHHSTFSAAFMQHFGKMPKLVRGGTG